ncbi:hypothetical protein VKT23_005362 [Stygiomarasmius scandens]|uniref:Uncharacterized protein n=1 Tax=Marasmiellus scandens TaxID=2682957 RepID=A0ABR1JRD5_9AGAR
MVKCHWCSRNIASYDGLLRHRPKCPARPEIEDQIFQPLPKRARIEDEAPGEGDFEPEDEEMDMADAENHELDELDEQPQEHYEAQAVPLPPPELDGPRRRKAPAKYQDFLISSEAAFVKKRRIPWEELDDRSPPPIHPEPTPEIESSKFSTEEPDPRPTYKTLPNSAGIFRVYKHTKPSRDPDAFVTTVDVADAPTFKRPEIHTPQIQDGFGPRKQQSLTALPSSDTYGPFDNYATYGLVDWSYRFKSTSKEAMRKLKKVLTHENFEKADVEKFNIDQDFQRLDNYVNRPADPQKMLPFLSAAADLWINELIQIPMPRTGYRWDSEDSAPKLVIQDFWHRKLVEIIKSAFQGPPFFDFHLRSFKQFWKPPGGKPTQRVYTEAYTSDRAAEYEQEVYSQLPPPPPGEENVETVIVWLMTWSDSTSLAQFGTASLWPIYVFLGNQPKRVRMKRSACAAHHLAYIPSLPDIARDAYYHEFGVYPTGEVLKFLKREIMQAVWMLLLDDELLDAYVHGLLLICTDTVLRRLYPRFFSQSADYLERILLVCMKFLAKCPCPRCKITKARIPQLGTKNDFKLRESKRRQDSQTHHEKIELARKLIFCHGNSVAGTAVANILEDESLTPVRNAFSTRLLEHGLDYYKAHPPDKLHDWGSKIKDVICALLRILHSLKNDSVEAFDQR